MAGLIVTTAATSEALTETEIREYLRIDEDSELLTLQLLRRAAREFCENYTGRLLLDQTLTMGLDATNEIYDPLWEGTRIGPYLNYGKDYIVMPTAPVREIVSVTTYDDADNATVMPSSRYYVDIAREPARVVLRTGETWPNALRVANAIEVQFKAGYANAGQIPHALKMGMLQHIAYLYDQRGDMKDADQASRLPPMVALMYQPYKLIGGLGTSAYGALG
jgi:hypothetical protein